MTLPCLQIILDIYLALRRLTEEERVTEHFDRARWRALFVFGNWGKVWDLFKYLNTNVNMVQYGHNAPKRPKIWIKPRLILLTELRLVFASLFSAAQPEAEVAEYMLPQLN